jgi:hypothetical protein
MAMPTWSLSAAGSPLTRTCPSASAMNHVLTRYHPDAFWGGDQRGHIDYRATF